MTQEQGASADQLRIIYALLGPSVRMASIVKVPLRDLTDLIEMAYYHELRMLGLKMRQMSERLSLSMRKVAMLSKRLKTNFFKDGEREGVARRLEFMLWAQPMSEARIVQTLTRAGPKQVRSALAWLVREGRVRKVERRHRIVFEPVPGATRLVSQNWQARLDGLHAALANLTAVVHGRFFDEHPNAFARTLNLRVCERDIGELERLYQDHIWKTLVRLDTAAKNDPASVAIDFSVLWSCSDAMRGALPSNDGEEA